MFCMVSLSSILFFITLSPYKWFTFISKSFGGTLHNWGSFSEDYDAMDPILLEPELACVQTNFNKLTQVFTGA